MCDLVNISTLLVTHQPERRQVYFIKLHAPLLFTILKLSEPTALPIDETFGPKVILSCTSNILTIG